MTFISLLDASSYRDATFFLCMILDLLLVDAERESLLEPRHDRGTGRHTSCEVVGPQLPRTYPATE